MRKILFLSFSLLIIICSCNPKLSNGLRKKDLTKDVEMITDKGTMIIRLSDSTPLHRNNFLKLVKQGFFDSVIFHRVIKDFMIQAGDPTSKHAKAGAQLGEADAGYTIPAEFRASLLHYKGAIAAARTGDDVNPKKASSGSQFYIVEGKKYSDEKLDTIEIRMMKKFLPEQREAYKTIGGTPWLDGNYTVFGQVIKGLNVVDSIAVVPTDSSDRPVADVRILKVKLVKRPK
ncbi:MAG: peptidylprolyl isomerase [Bacteroidetes bacterium]|nr:peptidylprolyl isomerase [Bacteroidota bacterium]MBS1935101.1 peptidylprolyl isomerase [Bacteroidota bacterium]